jgi:hypothetical protein
LEKKLEDNATALKDVKALLKRESERNIMAVGNLNGHLTAISRLLLITIAGLIGTQ